MFTREKSRFQETEKESGSSDATPLADLMIILLAIQLMVAHGAFVSLPGEIELPSAAADSKGLREEEQMKIVISFTDDGSLFWNEEPLPSLSELNTRVEREMLHRNPVRFVLAGDEKASYGLSMQLKAALYEAGVTEVDELMEEGR